MKHRTVGSRPSRSSASSRSSRRPVATTSRSSARQQRSVGRQRAPSTATRTLGLRHGGGGSADPDRHAARRSSGDTTTLGQDSQYGAALAIDYLDGTFDGNAGPARRPRRRAVQRGRPLLGRRRPDRRHDARRRPADRRRSSARAARAPRSASPTRSCPTRASSLISPSNTNPALDDGGDAPAVLLAHRAQRQDPGGASSSDFVYTKLERDDRPPRSTTRARTPRASPTGSRRTSRPAAARSRRRRRSTAPTPTSSRC